MLTHSDIRGRVNTKKYVVIDPALHAQMDAGLAASTNLDDLRYAQLVYVINPEAASSVILADPNANQTTFIELTDGVSTNYGIPVVLMNLDGTPVDGATTKIADPDTNQPIDPRLVMDKDTKVSATVAGDDVRRVLLTVPNIVTDLVLTWNGTEYEDLTNSAWNIEYNSVTKEWIVNSIDPFGAKIQKAQSSSHTGTFPDVPATGWSPAISGNRVIVTPIYSRLSVMQVNDKGAAVNPGVIADVDNPTKGASVIGTPSEQIKITTPAYSATVERSSKEVEFTEVSGGSNLAYMHYENGYWYLYITDVPAGSLVYEYTVAGTQDIVPYEGWTQVTGSANELTLSTIPNTVATAVVFDSAVVDPRNITGEHSGAKLDVIGNELRAISLNLFNKYPRVAVWDTGTSKYITTDPIMGLLYTVYWDGTKWICEDSVAGLNYKWENTTSTNSLIPPLDGWSSVVGTGYLTVEVLYNAAPVTIVDRGGKIIDQNEQVHRDGFDQTVASVHGNLTPSIRVNCDNGALDEIAEYDPVLGFVTQGGSVSWDGTNWKIFDDYNATYSFTHPTAPKSFYPPKTGWVDDFGSLTAFIEIIYNSATVLTTDADGKPIDPRDVKVGSELASATNRLPVDTELPVITVDGVDRVVTAEVDSAGVPYTPGAIRDANLTKRTVSILSAHTPLITVLDHVPYFPDLPATYTIDPANPGGGRFTVGVEGSDWVVREGPAHENSTGAPPYPIVASAPINPDNFLDLPNESDWPSSGIISYKSDGSLAVTNVDLDGNIDRKSNIADSETEVTAGVKDDPSQVNIYRVKAGSTLHELTSIYGQFGPTEVYASPGYTGGGPLAFVTVDTVNDKWILSFQDQPAGNNLHIYEAPAEPDWSYTLTLPLTGWVRTGGSDPAVPLQIEKSTPSLQVVLAGRDGWSLDTLPVTGSVNVDAIPNSKIAGTTGTQVVDIIDNSGLTNKPNAMAVARVGTDGNIIDKDNPEDGYKGSSSTAGSKLPSLRTLGDGQDALQVVIVDKDGNSFDDLETFAGYDTANAQSADGTTVSTDITVAVVAGTPAIFRIKAYGLDAEVWLKIATTSQTAVADTGMLLLYGDEITVRVDPTQTGNIYFSFIGGKLNITPVVTNRNVHA